MVTEVLFEVMKEKVINCSDGYTKLGMDLTTLNCVLKKWFKITIMYLLKWPKSRTVTAPNAGKDVEEQEILFIADGNAK